MMRPLHAETEVQRGDGGDRTVSPKARERGYEMRDASPRDVLIGMGSFLLLMAVGLAFAGGLLAWLEAHDERPRAPFASPAPPPPPHILADPAAERMAIERAARRRLDPARIEEAMRATAAGGWREDAPAPGDAEVARAHREALR